MVVLISQEVKKVTDTDTLTKTDVTAAEKPGLIALASQVHNNISM